MYKHILVPTDGSALSLKAARAAAKLAAKLKAKITALYVMPPYMPRTTSEATLPAKMRSRPVRFLEPMTMRSQPAS